MGPHRDFVDTLDREATQFKSCCSGSWCSAHIFKLPIVGQCKGVRHEEFLCRHDKIVPLFGILPRKGDLEQNVRMSPTRHVVQTKRQFQVRCHVQFLVWMTVKGEAKNIFQSGKMLILKGGR